MCFFLLNEERTHTNSHTQVLTNSNLQKASSKAGASESVSYYIYLRAGVSYYNKTAVSTTNLARAAPPGPCSSASSAAKYFTCAAFRACGVRRRQRRRCWGIDTDRHPTAKVQAARYKRCYRRELIAGRSCDRSPRREPHLSEEPSGKLNAGLAAHLGGRTVTVTMAACIMPDSEADSP